MDNSEKISTENKILAAAEQVFLRSGYESSRMQEIADIACINKAMLHYYFRSKDALFERIFENKFTLFFPKIQEQIADAPSFVEKICVYVELHIELLRENPYLPLFIINTIHKNPDFVKKLPVNIIKQFEQSYYADLADKKIRDIEPLQFFMSIISMCVFPFWPNLYYAMPSTYRKTILIH